MYIYICIHIYSTHGRATREKPKIDTVTDQPRRAGCAAAVACIRSSLDLASLQAAVDHNPTWVVWQSSIIRLYIYRRRLCTPISAIIITPPGWCGVDHEPWMRDPPAAEVPC